MNAEPHTAHGMRGRLPLAPGPEPHFRWRGDAVTRVEGFTDCVFAFAVTLLVVALEVPDTFAGLMDVVRGFPAFVICFVLLMIFWNAHYRFHRRYGFEDTFSRLITLAILVLVLFSVYPLKYLFTLVTNGVFGLGIVDGPTLAGLGEVRTLYLIYGLGFAGLWSLYALLYRHALRHGAALGLTAAEVVLTRASLFEYLIHVAVCLGSIAIAYATSSSWLPGVFYAVLGPLQAFNGWMFGRKLRGLSTAG